MITFPEYIQILATQHKAIRHSEEECHFTDINEDAQSGYAHMRMHYPCVVVDEVECTFSEGDSATEHDTYILLFLEHVADTGDADEIRQVFKATKSIAIDFIRRMHRDRRNDKSGIMRRFNLGNVEMGRVYLQDAGLYGYAVNIEQVTPFIDLDCNEAFVDYGNITT